MSEDSASRFLVDVEQLMITHSQLGGALAALVMLALVGATSCTTKPDVTKSKLNDSAIDAPALLRFETVRSILEDSKGNYWFGSWKEGVCRFDGKSLTYFTVEDGLSDNTIGPQRGHRLASRPLRPRGQQGEPLDREQWDRGHPA